ncbi:MAG: MarR family winged helix-turn-helix transcriptional regulator [Desulfoplanes sp.]
MTKFQKERRESPGYRIARLFRKNACLLEQKVTRMGLCYGQIPYIMATVEKDGQTQDELAAHQHVNRAATARMLKNMEAAGFITRTENPDNRRQKLVWPTAKAEALADDLLEILIKHNEMILTGFSREEKMLFLSLLDRVVVNVDTLLENNGRCHGYNG